LLATVALRAAWQLEGNRPGLLPTGRAAHWRAGSPRTRPDHLGCRNVIAPIANLFAQGTSWRVLPLLHLYIPILAGLSGEGTEITPLNRRLCSFRSCSALAPAARPAFSGCAGPSLSLSVVPCRPRLPFQSHPAGGRPTRSKKLSAPWVWLPNCWYRPITKLFAGGHRHHSLLNSPSWDKPARLAEGIGAAAGRPVLLLPAPTSLLIQ